MGWPAYSGASVLLHLSACDLVASDCVSICSWTCMADGSLLHILARMVVLSWHWYNCSAGDGSLMSMGLALSASRASCWIGTAVLGSLECMFDGLDACLGKSIGLWVMQTWGFVCHTPRYTESWTGHSHIVGHCQSEGLPGCHALSISLSVVRQACWHCSGQVEDIEWRSSLSRNCQLPVSQLLLAWRYQWHTSAMGTMVWV